MSSCPRRRTELLVREAGVLAGPRAVVVDMCCGSGAVGAALLAVLGQAEVHAVDIDPAAVACARRNLPEARVYEGDLFDAPPVALRGRVDILVANSPYLPTAAMNLLPPEARLHEPRAALDGGADGLEVQRRVIASATAWLEAGGHLLVETGEHQAPETVGAITRGGLVPRVATSDEFSATVVIGEKP